jgi:hypothetical protein
MAEKRIGDILDGLGVTSDLEDTDLVTSAVVILSIMVEGDSRPRLCIETNDGMGWIEQAGLLRIAERVCSDPPGPEDDDEPR